MIFLEKKKQKKKTLIHTINSPVVLSRCTCNVCSKLIGGEITNLSSLSSFNFTKNKICKKKKTKQKK